MPPYPQQRQGYSPTAQLITAYEAAYRYFRDTLFLAVLGEAMPDPVLTFSRSHKKKAVSFFVKDIWKPEGDPKQALSEIALVPEQTGRDPRELMSHLVREMVHFANYLAGTAPKSPGYHGRRWFERMEKLGLPAKPASPKSRIAVVHEIDPDGPFARAYEAMPAELLLPLTGTSATSAKTEIVPTTKDEAEQEEKPTMHGKRQRYECPMCHTTMRGPAGRRLICGDCEVPYAAESLQPVIYEHLEELAATVPA